MDDPIIKAQQFVETVAQRFGYALNPVNTALQRLVNHLAENKVKHGRYYCPCKQHYPLDTAQDPVCPCSTFKDEISNMGHCECHLFFDLEAAVQAKRRPGLLATVTCPG